MLCDKSQSLDTETHQASMNPARFVMLLTALNFKVVLTSQEVSEIEITHALMGTASGVEVSSPARKVKIRHR